VIDSPIRTMPAGSLPASTMPFHLLHLFVSYRLAR